MVVRRSRTAAVVVVAAVLGIDTGSVVDVAGAVGPRNLTHPGRGAAAHPYLQLNYETEWG